VLSFKITSVFGCGLTLEGLKLCFWVVQLCVSVDDLVIVTEKFESFGETFFGSVPFGEWRHNSWGIDDISWVLALGFKEMSAKFIDQTSGSSWVRALNIMVFTDFIENISVLLVCELGVCW